jgi:hypothetical protein
MNYSERLLSQREPGQSKFVIGRYSGTLYHYDVDHPIPEGARNEVYHAIVSSIFSGGAPNDYDAVRTPPNDFVLGTASYPIVNLLNPEISNRCNWMVLREEATIQATGLEYRGEHNKRWFLYGKHEAICTFLRNYPKFIPGDQSFRFVVMSDQFPEPESQLPILLGPKWHLREGKANTVTRMITTKNLNEQNVDIRSQKSLPKDWQLRVLTDEDLPAINRLLETNYPQHPPVQSATGFVGIVTDSGEVISTSTVVAQCSDSRLPRPITLVGNLATDMRFRRLGLASKVRAETLRRIFNDPVFSRGIVVADANSSSLPVNCGLGFLPVADFLWCICDRNSLEEKPVDDGWE